MPSLHYIVSCMLRMIAILSLGILLVPASFATDLEPAGRVVVAAGTVQAENAQGERRPLTRRSPFYSGEIIRTGAASEAQLSFSDGALVALQPDTEFKIDEYRFANQGGSGDRNMATLLKGGLRTVTGVIGKQDPDSYRLSTPVATIGVRGTHYAAVLESPRSLALAAWQGGIRVTSQAGVLDLGAGAGFNFARAEAGRRPRGLLAPPPTLKSETPAGLASKASTEQNAETTASSGSDIATSTGESAETDTAAQESAGGDPALEPTDAQAAPVAEGTQVLATDACSTCAPPQQTLADKPSTLIASPDRRFTDHEWSLLQTTPYLGVAVQADETEDFGFEGGHVLYHDTASPVFVNKEPGPHEPGYATAPIMDVLRRGQARIDAFSRYDVDAGHAVYWGTWNGTVDPAEIQIDPTNALLKELVYTPIHWATLLPTDPAVLAARTGTVSYNTVVVVHGGGSGGGPLTPADLSFGATVNFDTGAISAGMLNIYNGDEAWHADFAGQVRENVFDVMLNNSTSFVSAPAHSGPIEGDIGMAFTGGNGQAIGGAFSFQAIGNPRQHVEGVLLVR